MKHFWDQDVDIALYFLAKIALHADDLKLWTPVRVYVHKASFKC